MEVYNRVNVGEQKERNLYCFNLLSTKCMSLKTLGPNLFFCTVRRHRCPALERLHGWLGEKASYPVHLRVNEAFPMITWQKTASRTKLCSL